jgi:hypothetical protein
MKTQLSPVARLLLWDRERGSLAYDVVCAVILLFLFALPAAWLADPMVRF